MKTLSPPQQNSTAPSDFSDEDRKIQTCISPVSHGSEKQKQKQKQVPEWGKFCSFLFLSMSKDFLYAKDTPVESEGETVPCSAQTGACPSS